MNKIKKALMKHNCSYFNRCGSCPIHIEQNKIFIRIQKPFTQIEIKSSILLER